MPKPNERDIFSVLLHEMGPSWPKKERLDWLDKMIFLWYKSNYYIV